VSQILSAAMRRREVRVRVKTAVEGVTAGADAVSVALAGGEALEADTVLVAAGRTPNTAGLGLEALGVRLERGFIAADEFGRTGVPGVYAVGDAAGKWLLAYTAAAEGTRAAEHALGREVAPGDGVVPLTVFGDPEAATVGMTEAEAAARNLDVRVGRFPFAANGKALSIDETDGFAALVADRGTDRLLGGQVVGPHASDLIAEITLAVRLGATARDVAGTLHSHPTLSEAVFEAALDAHGEAVHKLRK
jgi:dihydrolipoamide dehydrogenase